MIYLLIEIAIYLIAAAAIGAGLGWTLRGLFGGAKRAAEAALDHQSKLIAAEADFAAKALKAEAQIARLKADLHAALAAPKPAVPDAAPAALAEAEARFRQRLTAAEAAVAQARQDAERARGTLAAADADWRARLAAAEAARELEKAELLAELAAARAAPPPPADPDPDFDRRVRSLEDALAEQGHIVEGLRAALAEAEESAAKASAALAAERARLSALDGARPASRAPRTPRARLAPLDDGRDDLKRIPGVGPAVETVLRGMGLDSFAAIGALEPARAEAIARGFAPSVAARLLREDWTAKARALAAERPAPAADETAPEPSPAA